VCLNATTLHGAGGTSATLGCDAPELQISLSLLHCVYLCLLHLKQSNGEGRGGLLSD